MRDGLVAAEAHALRRLAAEAEAEREKADAVCLRLVDGVVASPKQMCNVEVHPRLVREVEVRPRLVREAEAHRQAVTAHHPICFAVKLERMGDCERSHQCCNEPWGHYARGLGVLVKH